MSVYQHCILYIAELIRAGCSPVQCASAIRSLSENCPEGIALSRFVEEHARPGTIAEAIFNELAS